MRVAEVAVQITLISRSDAPRRSDRGHKDNSVSRVSVALSEVVAGRPENRRDASVGTDNRNPANRRGKARDNTLAGDSPELAVRPGAVALRPAALPPGPHLFGLASIVPVPLLPAPGVPARLAAAFFPASARGPRDWVVVLEG